MATVVGDEYTHIDIDDGTDITQHYLADETVRDSLLETKSVSGTTIIIDDAIDGKAPVSLPSGGLIYSRNMYKANITTRTTNGITFTADANDPNVVKVNGTATSNAYSYTTISTSNAGALLEPGTYCLAHYMSNGKLGDYFDNVKVYWNIINASTGANVNNATGDEFTTITLTAKSYVGVRIQVPSGKTVNNVTVSVYFSKALPYTEYIPYKDPQTSVMFKHSVVEFSSSSTMAYLRVKREEKPQKIRVGTFNLGCYNAGTGVDTVPPMWTDYVNEIAKVGADILCTQEDRVYYDVNNDITTFDKLYGNMYQWGAITSYATSYSSGRSGKGVYNNLAPAIYMRYTFDASGTTEQGGGDSIWSSATLAVLYQNDQSILIVSAHLAPYEWNVSARKSQITELLTLVNALNADHTIICGDFNTWDDEMNTFGTGWITANNGAFGDFATYDTGNKAFDNIIVQSGDKIQGVDAITNSLGYHYAFIADLVMA